MEQKEKKKRPCFKSLRSGRPSIHLLWSEVPPASGETVLGRVTPFPSQVLQIQYHRKRFNKQAFVLCAGPWSGRVQTTLGTREGQ